VLLGRVNFDNLSKRRAVDQQGIDSLNCRAHSDVKLAMGDLMGESKLRTRKRTHRWRPLQLPAVSAIAVADPPPAIPLQPLDWSAILKSLPQDPPKGWVDLGWNIYKQELWGKYKPDSLVGFELFRMAARSSDMPEGLKFAANFLALLCAVDGYSATVEGLRKAEEKRTVVLANTSAPVPRLFPMWPS